MGTQHVGDFSEVETRRSRWRPGWACWRLSRRRRLAPILTGSPSNFESNNDGDMIVAAGSTNVTRATVTSLRSAMPATRPLDDSFTPGRKQDTACPTTEGHQNPGKDDFTAAASFAETASNGDVYRIRCHDPVRLQRFSLGDIELKQSDVCCPGQPLGRLTVRTARRLPDRDRLHRGWGRRRHPRARPGSTSGACFVSPLSPVLGVNVITLADAAAEGGTNTVTIPRSAERAGGWSARGRKFAEFGINLTARRDHPGR